jgi:hypothetical protein
LRLNTKKRNGRSVSERCFFLATEIGFHQTRSVLGGTARHARLLIRVAGISFFMAKISREKFVKMQKAMDKLLRNESADNWGELLTKAHEISRVYAAMWDGNYWKEFLSVINFDVLAGVELKTSNQQCGRLYHAAEKEIEKREKMQKVKDSISGDD